MHRQDIAPVIPASETPLETVAPEPSKTVTPETPAKSVKKPENPERIPGVRYPVSKGSSRDSGLSLTFDDGFSRESIVTVLDIFKKYDIKCTFFITGYALEGNPDLWKRAAAEGHQVCNHTKTHRFLKGLAEAVVKKEVEGWEKCASSVLGDEYVAEMKKDFPYIRLPGGSGSRDARLLKEVGELSYIPVGWSTETIYGVLRHYPRKKGMEEDIKADISRYVLKTSGKGSIILLHLNKYDASALEDIIGGILKKGCRFMLLSELMDSKKN